jgi:hypothetical protein
LDRVLLPDLLGRHLWDRSQFSLHTESHF